MAGSAKRPLTNLRRFEKLLPPFQIRHLKFKNRMVKVPQASAYTEPDCYVNERLKNFYESIAAGGVGMTILGALAWEPPLPGGRYIGSWDDKFVPGLRELTNIFHRHGRAVFAQFHHQGPSAPQDLKGGPPVGPPSLREDELPCPIPLLQPSLLPFPLVHPLIQKPLNIFLCNL